MSNSGRSSPAAAVTLPAPRLSIVIANGLSLTIDGGPVVLANRKARALVAVLALNGGHAMARSHAAGLLWPDVGEQQARLSLRQAVFELRGAFGAAGADLLRLGRETLALNPTAVTVDLLAAAAMLEAGVLPDRRLRPELAHRMLAGTEDTSPLFAEWLAQARADVAGRIRRALEAGFEDQSLPASIRRSFAELCLTMDPTHEPACRALMRLAAAAGDTGVALRAYTALYHALDTELDTEPSTLTQALVADLKRGLLDPQPPSPPPPASMPAPIPAPVPPLAPPDVLADRPRVAPFFGSVPVVAVLPFRSIGPEPTPAYLIEGLLEDLVCTLACLREPVVISSESTRLLTAAESGALASTGQGSGSGAKLGAQLGAQLGARLGATYVVSGTLRSHSRLTRLTVQLSDANSGALVWAGAYDLGLADLFGAQEAVTSSIAQTLVPRVQEAELRRSRQRPPSDLTAYQLVLQARERIRDLHAHSFDEARSLLERAALIDSSFPGTYAALANWHVLRIFQGWSPDAAADTAAIMTHAREGLRLDAGHPRILALLGHTHVMLTKNYDEAIRLHDRAYSSAPNDAESLMFSSAAYSYIGRGTEAVDRAERALALSPLDPMLYKYQFYCCLARYAAGDLAGTADYGLQSLSNNGKYTASLRFAAAALAGLGRMAEARDMAGQLLALEPGFRVGPYQARQAFRDPERGRGFCQQLLEAGLPP